MRTKQLSLMGMCFAVVATLLVACGGGDSDSDGSAPESAAPDLQAAPADAKWESVAGIKTPVETADGPRQGGKVPSGFEHTPQGAVVAAINAQVAMATADDDTWPEVSKVMLVDGPGRDQWAQGRSLMTVSGTVKDPAKFKGFRIADYKDELTTMVLAVEYPGVGLTAVPVQVTWQNDWKAVLPTQQQAVQPKPIKSMDGFTDFSAES